MIALIVSIACLALNAFFVAAEFALVKVRATQLKPRAQRGERRAIAAEKVLNQLDRFLSVTQLGITVASLGLGWIGEPALEELANHVARSVTGENLGRGGHIAVDVLGLTLLTFLHLLIGELVPKAIAIRHSEETALFTSIPLRIVNTAFAPLLWVLEKSQRAVLRLIGVDPELDEGALSEDEILGILAANVTRTRRGADKQRTVERVLRFAERPVRQIMVPRVDVIALPIDSSPDRAHEMLKRHEFSRILLFGRSIDDIAGYLYVKDFLFDEGIRQRTRASLHGLERHALFVPETRDVLAVVRDMQRERTPIAVVVDEYGGTSGLVTMEDLVEEVFGEIRDETDVEHEKVVQLGGGAVWEVDARATIDELRLAGAPIPSDEPALGEPVGKVVVDRLAHLPRIGDAVPLSTNLIAEVIAISRRRIQRLRVRFA